MGEIPNTYEDKQHIKFSVPSFELLFKVVFDGGRTEFPSVILLLDPSSHNWIPGMLCNTTQFP